MLKVVWFNQVIFEKTYFLSESSQLEHGDASVYHRWLTVECDLTQMAVHASVCYIRAVNLQR